MVAQVEFQSVDFSYGHGFALQQLSFSIQPGEIVSIVGPNGSGKSTLLKLLMGYYPPNAGKIFFLQKDLQKIKRNFLAKHVAHLGQDAPMDFPFTCCEVVMMGRAPHLGRFQFAGEVDQAKVQSSMQATHCWHLANRDVREISAGERLRVFLARVLAQEAELLLLDEPSSHLDLQYMIWLYELLKELKQNFNKTMLLVLHDIQLAAKLSDKIMLMANGKIHLYGQTADVLTSKNLAQVFKVDESSLNLFA